MKHLRNYSVCQCWLWPVLVSGRRLIKKLGRSLWYKPGLFASQLISLWNTRWPGGLTTNTWSDHTLNSALIGDMAVSFPNEVKWYLVSVPLHSLSPSLFMKTQLSSGHAPGSRCWCRPWCFLLLSLLQVAGRALDRNKSGPGSDLLISNVQGQCEGSSSHPALTSNIPVSRNILWGENKPHWVLNSSFCWIHFDFLVLDLTENRKATRKIRMLPYFAGV